ncbi:MAG: SH3 domain-containing protein [Candidatus Binatia bacterium]
MGQPKFQTRLCSHCANSIAMDAVTCPYCKADVLLSAEPEWPRHGADFDEPAALPEKAKMTVKSKAILVLGLLVFALGVYLVGGNVQRNDLGPVLADQKTLLAEQQDLLKEKDQRIQNLESQLGQLRQDNQGTSRQIAGFKAQLEERQKDLAAAQRKLTAANREIERLSASRVAASAPRPAVATVNPPAKPAVTTRLSRALEPRTYETVRSTPVYEQPAGSARVVAQISKGTEITVVGSGGGWLEIRSRHGKPPGFVRADDAMFVSRAN